MYMLGPQRVSRITVMVVDKTEPHKGLRMMSVDRLVEERRCRGLLRHNTHSGLGSN